MPPRYQSLRASNRFGELDDLRGIAALAVVGHHLFLALPLHVAIATTGRSRQRLRALIVGATVIGLVAHPLGTGGSRQGFLAGCGRFALLALSALTLILPWLTQRPPATPRVTGIVSTLHP